MDLYEQHKNILEMAVRRQGFHYRMPEGGQEAMDRGLVGESDPTWMMSDHSHTSNGFTLTEAGTRLVRAQGMVCQCALCGAYNGSEPKLAVDPLCANCQSSAEEYGMNELEGIGTACTNCVKYTERKRPELLPAQHMQAKLEAERSMGEKEVEHVQYCGTCWKGKNQCRGLAAARARDRDGLEPKRKTENRMQPADPKQTRNNQGRKK